jgi:peptidoglycan/LPS O-acetylase OafA/YrhL
MTTPVSPINYIWSDISLKMTVYNIAGGPTGVPYPRAWNGSLWTLYYEFACYLIVGVCCCWAAFRSKPVLIALLFVAITVGRFNASYVAGYAQNREVQWVLHLAPFFLAGSLIFMIRSRVAVRAWLAMISLLTLVAIPLLGGPRGTVFCALPLAYLCLWLGAVLPLQRIGRTNDISYGVYIYGFPVQQTLSLFGLHRHGYLLYTTLSAIMTIPFAAASWWLVERPALGSRRRVPVEPAANNLARDLSRV